MDPEIRKTKVKKGVFLGKTTFCPKSNLKEDEIVLIIEEKVDPKGLYCYVATTNAIESASKKQVAIAETIEIEWLRKPFMTANQELQAFSNACVQYLRENSGETPVTIKKNIAILDYGSEPGVIISTIETEKYSWQDESEAIEEAIQKKYKLSQVHYLISEQPIEVKFND